MKKIMKTIGLYLLHIIYGWTVSLLAKIFVPKLDAKIVNWLHNELNLLTNGEFDKDENVGIS